MHIYILLIANIFIISHIQYRNNIVKRGVEIVLYSVECRYKCRFMVGYDYVRAENNMFLYGWFFEYPFSGGWAMSEFVSLYFKLKYPHNNTQHDVDPCRAHATTLNLHGNVAGAILSPRIIIMILFGALCII